MWYCLKLERCIEVGDYQLKTVLIYYWKWWRERMVI